MRRLHVGIERRASHYNDAMNVTGRVAHSQPDGSSYAPEDAQDVPKVT
ncbi:MAG: hypothetical protein ACREL4_06360 [Gemmatimonadales bacterium]